MDKLEHLAHHHRKTIVTAFFNGAWECFLNILPRCPSMDAKHFGEETIGGLEDVCCPEGRNPHERKSTLQFEDALIHNIRMVMGQLEQSGFKRMSIRPSSRFGTCDFFLMTSRNT
jgi:hypothetical protein